MIGLSIQLCTDYPSLSRKSYIPQSFCQSGMLPWWTGEDMLNEAEVMQPIDFAIWMLDHFRSDAEQEGLLNTWLGSLKSKLGEEVIAYKFDDDNDSNCAFAPYILKVSIVSFWPSGIGVSFEYCYAARCLTSVCSGTDQNAMAALIVQVRPLIRQPLDCKSSAGKNDGCVFCTLSS
jgi:hypothetical protein